MAVRVETFCYLAPSRGSSPETSRVEPAQMEGSCEDSGGGALFSGRASLHWGTWVWYLVEDQNIRGAGLRGRNAVVVTWLRLLDSKPPAKHVMPFSVLWVVSKVLFSVPEKGAEGWEEGDSQRYSFFCILIYSSPAHLCVYPASMRRLDFFDCGLGN